MFGYSSIILAEDQLSKQDPGRPSNPPREARSIEKDCPSPNGHLFDFGGLSTLARMVQGTLRVKIEVQMGICFKSLHQVRSVLSLLPLLANPALSLENLTVTMTKPLNAAAAIVLRISQSHVSRTTQPLAPDSGRCHHFALQKAVAAKVILSKERTSPQTKRQKTSHFCLLL